MGMTEQEAIKKAIRYFECMKSDAVVVLDSGFGTRKGESDLVYRNRKIYAELAIKALEMQIAKEPRDIDEEHNTFMCPSCMHTLIALDDMKIHKHCLMCGQKLDWGNEDATN